MSRKKFFTVLFPIILWFSLAQGFEAEELQRGDFVFYVFTPDVHKLIDSYEKSASKKFLQESEIICFSLPLRQQINALFKFWLEHLQLDEDSLRQLIRDKFLFAILMVPGSSSKDKPQTVRLSVFRANNSAVKNWLKRFEGSLPAKVERQEIKIRDINFTSVHYYIKEAVSTEVLFHGGHEDTADVLLPQLFRECELFLAYGIYKDYFFLSFEKPDLVKSTLANDKIFRQLFSDSASPKDSLAILQVFANLDKLIQSGRIKGKFSESLLLLFGISRAQTLCYFYPEELRLITTFYRTGKHPSAPSERGEQKVDLGSLALIPRKAEYFLLSKIEFEKAWQWFNESLPKLSDRVAEYKEAVLTNFEKNYNLPLNNLFTRALGNEVALFPVYLQVAETNIPTRGLILFLMLKDEVSFVSFLRPILQLISRITYFELAEKTMADGRLFIFKERRSQKELPPRQIVFWVGKGLCLVGSKATAIKVVLEQRALSTGDESTTYPLSEKVPLLKDFSYHPMLIIHWERFDLAPLVEDVQRSATALGLKMEDFNRQVFDLDKQITPVIFQKYFGAADLLLFNPPDETHFIFQLRYK